MINVLLCGPKSSSGGVAQHTENLVRNLSDMEIQVIWYQFNGSAVRKLYQRTIGMLFQGFKNRRQFDIIHVQFSVGNGSFSGAITGTIVSILLNKQLVLTYHNSNIPESFLFEYCIRRAKAIFLVSHYQKHRISKIFPQYTQKTSVISNGFDNTLFFPQSQQECQEKLKIKPGGNLILSIGNLLEVKGHKYLIEAMDKLVSDGKDIQCIIIGSGPLKESISKQISELSLEKQILLVGGKVHSEIPLWINAADLFVLPSLNEGNPTVMFEALGCGKPFVGTKVGGVPEIIKSDKYGLLVEPGNPCDLSDRILTALQKNWDSEEIETYAQQYTWAIIAKKTIDVYSKRLM